MRELLPLYLLIWIMLMGVSTIVRSSATLFVLAIFVLLGVVAELLLCVTGMDHLNGPESVTLGLFLIPLVISLLRGWRVLA